LTVSRKGNGMDPAHDEGSAGQHSIPDARGLERNEVFRRRIGPVPDAGTWEAAEFCTIN